MYKIYLVSHSHSPSFLIKKQLIYKKGNRFGSFFSLCWSCQGFQLNGGKKVGKEDQEVENVHVSLVGKLANDTRQGRLGENSRAHS